MSHAHRHTPPDPAPTLAAFLRPMVGHEVALIRDGQRPLRGQLAAVDADIDDGTPWAVVNDQTVDLTECRRIKLHFNSVTTERKHR